MVRNRYGRFLKCSSRRTCLLY